MKRKRKGWLLIVTLLIVSMLLSGCGESVTNEESNSEKIQSEHTLSDEFEIIEEGKFGTVWYWIVVHIPTKVKWVYTVVEGAQKISTTMEPMIDSEGNPLLYEGELTTQK